MTIKFASIHNHSHYSMLDGIGSSKQYVKACMERDIHAFALTDHGTCAGLLDFYEEGRKKGFKIILGEEFYIEDTEVVFASPEVRKQKEYHKYYHLIVLAKNRVGYENLLKLSSLAYSPDRFYHRPRITFDDLFQNKEGLIVTSACIIGPVAENILLNKVEKAWEYARRFKQEFGDDWYLEIEADDLSWDWDSKLQTFVQKGFNPQNVANLKILEIGCDLQIPVVIGVDAHMVNKEDKPVQDVALRAYSGNSNNRWVFYNTYYLKTGEEIWEAVQKNHPYITRQQFEGMCNVSMEIADKCNVELKFSPQLPQIDEEVDKLWKLIVKWRRINFSDEKYMSRLKYEIDVIHRNGKFDLLPYFYVLEDLASWCQENDIIVGPGRGSACGSLLAYCLGITSIDPIQYGLLFERFLSLPRILDGTLPDIDLDFSDAEKVKEYLKNKYGQDKVFSIGTLQQMGIRQAWTDVSRAILDKEFDYQENKNLSKGLPQTLPEAYKQEILKGTYLGLLIKDKIPETDEEKEICKLIREGVVAQSFDVEWNRRWRDWVESHPKGKIVYEVMMKILGIPRQSSTHACAVAISREPMNKLIPTCMSKEVPTTQFTGYWCEHAGIVKFDILSLNTLRDFQVCLKMIKERRGLDLNIYTLPRDDQQVFQQFMLGNTDSVFQFNTNLQKHVLHEIGVSSVLDLAIVTAIVRPGSLGSGMDKMYIENRKKGLQYIQYEHPVMKEITEQYFGCLIFQEQIMNFFHKIGGLSLIEAEQVRRGISKSKADLLKKYKGQFLEYTTTKLQPVMTEQQAQQMWNKIELYCEYSFNLSHAVAYAFVGYVCMWLKTHYPLEWWYAVLKNCDDDEDFKLFYKKCPINLIPPDINLSKEEFYIDSSGNLVIPLSKIRNVGEAGVKSIVKGQPYHSFEDFYNRVEKRVVKKNVIDSLILAGAFDNCGYRKSDDLLHFFYQCRGEPVPEAYRHLDRIKLCNLKSQMLSFTSFNYLEMFSDHFQNAVNFEGVRDKLPGHGVITGGLVKKITKKKTKAGKDYLIVKLYNDNDEMTVKFWNVLPNDMFSKIKEEDVVKVIGDVDNYNGEISINGKHVTVI